MGAIVAFDLSLRSTGIARLSYGKMELSTSKTDRKKVDLQDAVRVQSQRAVTAVRFRPSVAIMESGALGAIRGQGYEELGALRWLIKDYMRHNHQMDVVQISPSHLKKTVTGDGRAKKDAVMEKVVEVCAQRGWTLPANDDEADAIALILTWEADNESDTTTAF